MTEYGYVRISSKDQNPNRQIDAMMAQGLKTENIFVDMISGKDFKRPEYRRMLRTAKKGDLIVIKSIDRLGRNYKEIIEQWGVLTKERGINIEVLDMPLLNTAIEHNGLTGVFIADLVLQVLAYVAETERSFIHQRQQEGIAAARSRGVRFGRRKKDEPAEFEAAYVLWVEHKKTTREAAKLCGMSHSTFYRRCKEHQKTDTTIGFKE